jgi:UDP-N-acetylglucosamine 2-epimerase (non-hydrolysing)
MEGAAVMMTGLESDRVMQGLNILERQMSEKKSTQIKIDDYSIPDVS